MLFLYLWVNNFSESFFQAVAQWHSFFAMKDSLSGATAPSATGHLTVHFCRLLE